MGELHLDILVDRLRREYGVDANVGRPQVVYRETLAKAGEGEARFERTLEDESLFGHARVRVAPRPRGSGNDLRMALVKPEVRAGRAQDPGCAARRSSTPPWRARARRCARGRRAIRSRTSRW